MSDQKFVSIAAEDFIKGGLLNDCDIEVISARWVCWDYDGNRSTKDVLAAEVILKDLANDEEVTQHWSNGNISDFCPNPEDDGDTLVRQSGKEKLPQGNMYLFIQSLQDHGMPPIRTGKLSALAGIQCHVERVDPPKRSFKDQGDQTTRKGDGKVLMCVGAVKMPGETKTKGKGKPNASTPATTASTRGRSTSTPAPAASNGSGSSDINLDDDQTSRASDILMEIITSAKDGSSKMSEIRMQGFKAMKDDSVDERNAIMKAITDADWLTSNGFAVTGSGTSAKVAVA